MKQWLFGSKTVIAILSFLGLTDTPKSYSSVGSIILRGNACYSRVKSLSIPLSILDALAVYVLPYDNGSYSNVSVTAHMLFKR